MKRLAGILCIVLMLVSILPGCGKTLGAKGYYVRKIPERLGLEGEPEYMLMDDLGSAKKYVDENAQYGCIVVNEKMEYIYSPCGQLGSDICYQAKIVCDYIRDENFRYGNAMINPAFDCSEKTVSCDRLVDWVLYRVGFTDQPYQNGKCVSGPWLTNWCIDQGFKKISKVSELQAGDIIFVRRNSNGDPLHTFIFSGETDSKGIFYRYDAGSDTRIQSTQPFSEAISEFMYGYRPTRTPDNSKPAEEVSKQNRKVPEVQNYSVPAADTAPVIDGNKDAVWEKALSVKLDYTNTVNMTGEGECQGGTFSYLWDDEALYLFAEITDKTPAEILNKAKNGSYNSKDGVQMCLYVNQNCTAATAGQLFFFSFCPKASDGNAYAGEHFIYSNGSTGKDVPEITVASAETADGYTVEARIPQSVFEKASPAIRLSEGTVFAMGNVIMDTDDYTQELFCDTAWFNAPKSNKYTLSAK